MTQSKHWLTRPETIRKLWMVGSTVLALTVLAELAVELHPHFELEALFGFHAAYGFLTCVAMILFAKLLGFVLKRADTYYDD